MAAFSNDEASHGRKQPNQSWDVCSHSELQVVVARTVMDGDMK